MDIVFNLLLIAHLGAFAVGVATTVAMPIIMARLSRAPAEARPLFGSIGLTLSRNARIAFGLLALTGIAMVYVRYGGFEGQNPWFWLKMVLVLVVFLAILSGFVLKPGTLSPRLMAWVTRLAMIGIVVAAVFAFN